MSDGEKQGLWDTFKGVWAAFLGVQSSKKQEEDFTKGSATNYIIVGLVFVVIFILVMVGIVNLVMSNVGN